MRSLQELLNSEKGREKLQENSIFIDTNKFANAIKDSSNEDEIKPIYGAQQQYLDYAPGVTKKIAALKDLDRQGFKTKFIWVDTDSATSDGLMTRFFWPGIGLPGTRSYRAVSNSKAKEIEVRNVQLDKDYLKKTRASFMNALRQSKQYDEKRFQEFWQHFEENDNLSDLSLKLSEFLIEQYFNYVPSAEINSANQGGYMRGQINQVLENMDEVIRITNQGIQDLINEDIDPQISPRDQNYLPIKISCPKDNKRLSLKREVKGSNSYGIAKCKCGNSLEFHLGHNNHLSADAIYNSVNWSPDVLLTALLNDAHSGQVGGKSSALYGMVFNKIMKEVLGKKPIPLLVPTQYGEIISNIQTGLIPHYFNK